LQAEEIAQRYTAHFFPIYCFCSDESLWKERMQGRTQYVPDWTPVGWEEVLRLQGMFEPWQPAKTLFLDAVQPVEANLEHAIQWICQKVTL
jgi:hypothetical protein